MKYSFYGVVVVLYRISKDKVVWKEYRFKPGRSRELLLANLKRSKLFKFGIVYQTDKYYNRKKVVDILK